ncbi:MAG TPA: DUF885 domain-containing protein [Bryobacteraceae bacterium]|nr:DUF885 domain-containing protein [Bryobacteraceae bacterium]
MVRTILLGCLLAASAAAQTDARLNALADRFFNEYYFHFYPTTATSDGFHQYDTKLEDYSQRGIQAQIHVLTGFEREFAALSPSPDRDLVLGRIRADLLALRDIRSWEKNPDDYSSGVTNSLFTIISRNFAPQEERMKSAIARERQIPEVFAAARENLKNPPRVYTEIALEQLPGIVGFFEHDVPEAFAEVTDRKLQDQFKAANRKAIVSLREYQTFLKTNLLPRSNGDFRIGAENYRKKLLYEEMVDVPLDRLLAIGYENLRQNQQALERTAAKIDPNKSPRDVLTALEKDHPLAGDLLSTFRGVLAGLRDFVTRRQIVTIPSSVPPIVEETPPFLRALTTASMDTPGPYEKVAKEAFFNVTLPEKGWDKARREDYMKGFNRGTIISTAIHEVYPGHYVQFLWLRRVPSKIRKLLGCSSNAEGWAHYTEQMMLDEGYGNGDLKLRLGQLQDALLRDARYIVGIEMHTGHMSLDRAVEFFEKEGYQTHEVALKEAKRGTSDPTYLVYTLGKLEILKLREDYRKREGARFSLKAFHDAFLAQGYPPIKIVREELLGNSGPLL